MLAVLLDPLKSPTPEARIDALCALVMLEEPEALGPLAQMWRSETHEEVRKVIRWAGTQLQAVKDRGYTSAAGMARAFRLDREPTEEELEKARKERDLLARIQHGASAEEHKQHGTGTGGTGGLVGRAATVGAMSVAFGLSGAMTASMMGTGVSPSSNMENADRPQIGKEPIVPARPSTMNITLALKRLGDAYAETRKSAILQLRDLNNLAALAPLGRCFVRDADPSVREAAQATGKLIYFSALYWEKRATGELKART